MARVSKVGHVPLDLLYVDLVLFSVPSSELILIITKDNVGGCKVKAHCSFCNELRMLQLSVSLTAITVKLDALII